MKRIFRHSLVAFTLIAMAQPIFSANQSTTKKVVDVAKYANETIFAKFYKIESIRTAAMRSAMALYCLSDGTCSSNDAIVLALAIASNLTALTYDANAAQRCWWLPKKFNLIADGIATIASCDASWLPITGSQIEGWTRSIIGWGSTTASTVSYLGSK